jgi:alpha-mannosidase
VHDDRELLERRIERELWDRVLPLVHAANAPLDIRAGATPDELSPFVVGSPWGAPWATTWFELTGNVPENWLGRSKVRVEAVIDLGFTRTQAGFQAEGLIVERRSDGTFAPRQGIHPQRTNYRIDDCDGPVTLLVEAASNPSFRQFVPSRQGLPETASTDPIYRFRTASLVLVDIEAEALAHDLDVLDGTMRALAVSDPRRAKMRMAIVAALDALPDIAAARQRVASQLRPAGTDQERRHRIVATGHAHIDTAWLWPIRETIRKCTRTFASATALMDDDSDFVFSCSQAQQYAWIEEWHPDLFARIIERVERGQWVPVGGMWVEADMNLPSAESLARQIVFGQRYFTEKFGAPCREVWIPDVFGYPAGLPQLFAAGGMDRFVTQKLSWNKQNRFPHHTFWWEGLDGTRVLTHFPPVDTYNAEVTPHEVAHSVERFQDHSWSGVSLMPFGHGDGGGGPTREMLERAHRMADLGTGTTVELGRASDVFDAVEREAVHGAPVPVWRGELYFETHRGTLTSQLRTKLGNRRCERLLVEAELWSATLGRPADVDDLWREVLTQQFHDILPGSSIAWVHRDAEKVFGRVEAELGRRIASMLDELAPAELTIANPADVAFAGVVSLAQPSRLAGFDEQDQQRLADGTVAVRASVSALGVTALEAMSSDDRVVMSDSSMTNRHLAVRWNSHGDITSIIDIAAQRELIPQGSTAARIGIARDQPVEYDAWDLESWTRELRRPFGCGVVVVEDAGPLVGRVSVTRRLGPSSIVVVYELQADARQLLVHVELDWHHAESHLTIDFPFDVRADTAACDVQLGVTHRPTHRSSSWDAAKFEICAHRFVSLSEPSFGVAVLNTGRYGHSVFDGSIRVSLARAAKYPDPHADQGMHSVTFAVQPHDGDLAAVRAAASTLNQPPRIVSTTTPTSPQGPVVAVVADQGDMSSVEIDAVKLADDGSGDLIVRLHEAVGDRIEIGVSCRHRIASASRCDLMESPRVDEECVDGIVSTTLRPFELVTLRLEVAADDFTGR